MGAADTEGIATERATTDAEAMTPERAPRTTVAAARVAEREMEAILQD
jgi:hypothetical protein